MTDFNRRTVLGALGAAATLPLVPGMALRPGRAAQGRLRLCRPDRRLRLDLRPRTGPPPGRRGARRQGRDHHRRERRRRPGRRARHPPARPGRQQADLHHLVRLHEPDDQGRQAVPGRQFRARHRLPARRQRRDLQRPLPRGPRGDRHHRRHDVQDRHGGYIGSFPIPEVVMGINAFQLAAQRSTRTSRPRSSGSRPGTIRPRRPTPPAR